MISIIAILKYLSGSTNICVFLALICIVSLFPKCFRLSFIPFSETMACFQDQICACTAWGQGWKFVNNFLESLSRTTSSIFFPQKTELPVFCALAKELEFYLPWFTTHFPCCVCIRDHKIQGLAEVTPAWVWLVG